MTAMTAPVALQADGPAWQMISGGESFTDGENNYFTAWFDMPDGRHVICRLIVPLHVARSVRDQANREWTKGQH